jgi:hypothetical protein
MDPWLEHPALWPDVHERLIIAIAEYLGPILRPRYYVAVGIHSYVTTLPIELPQMRYPDVMVVDTAYGGAVTAPAIIAVAEPVVVNVPVPEPVEESYLEVREVASGDVITVIEILSPTNKQSGEGRKTYKAKRLEIFRSRTRLVEIDLLRAWEPMLFWGHARTSHYRILVRRGERRERADLYAFNVRDPIPRFPLPLQEGDVEPAVDLKPLLDGLYDKASYDLRVDYSKPPVPPLSDADAEWTAQVLLTFSPPPRGHPEL